MIRSIPLWEEAAEQWYSVTGRRLSFVEPYRMEEAEIALVASSTPSLTATEVIDDLRDMGHRVGLLRLRMFRPFPVEAVRHYLRGVTKVAVLDRNCSYGHHGVWFAELKSALYTLPAEQRPTLFGYIAGLGGRDITHETLRTILQMTMDREQPEPETAWIRNS